MDEDETRNKSHARRAQMLKALCDLGKFYSTVYNYIRAFE